MDDSETPACLGLVVLGRLHRQLSAPVDDSDANASVGDAAERHPDGVGAGVLHGVGGQLNHNQLGGDQ
jgi:hypothetical protein